jgi:hypothetical protein
MNSYRESERYSASRHITDECSNGTFYISPEILEKLVKALNFLWKVWKIDFFSYTLEIYDDLSRLWLLGYFEIHRKKSVELFKKYYFFLTKWEKHSQ